jgi:hypothetical protein
MQFHFLSQGYTLELLPERVDKQGDAATVWFQQVSGYSQTVAVAGFVLFVTVDGFVLFGDG